MKPVVSRAEWRGGFGITVLLLGIVGVFLRLYLIHDQIPLDDEWHRMIYSLSHPFRELAGSSSIGATSPPLNLYNRLLLKTVGWSELTLLLPSLVPGILALFLFPLLARKAHGPRVAVIFALMLALSPFLIFYTRVMRPYSMLVFLGFATFYSAGFWVLTGRKTWLALYVCAVPLAVYFHPAAVVSFFPPLVAGWVCLVVRKYSTGGLSAPRVIPSLASTIGVGALVAVLSAIALQPCLGITMQMSNSAPLPDLAGWRQFLMLLFGTSRPRLAAVLLCLGAFGSVALVRRNLFWGTALGLQCVLSFVMVLAGRFEKSNLPIVLARYVIGTFPVFFVWTAVALEALPAAMWKAVGGPHPCNARLGIPAAMLILGAGLVFTSPLAETYKPPNSFTNHSAFQESYSRKGWHRPYRSAMAPSLADYVDAGIPPFYRSLPPDGASLIEYPMPLGNHFNLYYYYQRFHGGRVVAGYADAVLHETPTRDFVYGDYLINHVLRLVENKNRLNFRNMVDIHDAVAVARTGAQYLIVHRDLTAEFFPGLAPRILQTPDLNNTVRRLKAEYGNPVYEDAHVLVFDVQAAPGSSRKMLGRLG